MFHVNIPLRGETHSRSPHAPPSLLLDAQRSTRGAKVAARAGLYFPGDQEYIAQINADYPDKGIANWEEGRALFSELGYSILDIRAVWNGDVTFPSIRPAHPHTMPLLASVNEWTDPRWTPPGDTVS